MVSFCDGDADVSEYAHEIPGLCYPTHEAFSPTRWFTDLVHDYVLFAVYEQVEETDYEATVAEDLAVVEATGGMPLLVHTVDPITALHNFYVYARHDDRALMARWDAMTHAANPGIPAV